MKASRLTIVYLFATLLTIGNVYSQDWQAKFDSSVHYMDLKSYDQAIYLLESVLESSYQKSLKNPFDTTYGTSLQYLGYYYELSNEFKKAEEYYQKSIKWWENSENAGHPVHINAVSYLSILYLTLIRYEEAEKYALQTIDMAIDRYGKNHFKHGIALNALAETYRRMGKTAEAISIYEQCIAINESLGLTETTEHAVYLNNLAIANQRITNYGQAEINYLKSMEIIERLHGLSHPEYSTGLNNLSMLYKTMGRIADAERLIKQMMSLTIQYHGKNNTTYALALLNSAGIYLALKKYDKALTNYQEADKIYHQIYQTKFNHGSSYALQNMASILEKRGNINEAEDMLLKSADIKKKLFGEKNWNYAISLKALGIFYCNINRFEESKKYLMEAIDIINYNYGDQSDKRFEFKYRLVRAQIKESPEEKYFDDYLEVMKFTIEKISLNLPFLNESEKREFWNSRSKMFNHFYDYSINMSDSAKIYNVAGALYDLQLKTKSVLLNSMTKLRKDIERSKDEELEALFEEWTRKRNLYARATTMSIKEREEKLINLDSLRNGINELEKELSVKSISFSRDTLSKSVSWRDIQSKLQPGEAAIELLKYKIPIKESEDSICYAALIITHQTADKPKIVLFPKGNAMDTEDFKNYRKTLSQFKTDKRSYDKYWKPIQRQLTGIRKVYFSADGIYNLINLNTLYNPESGKYLIDELDIHLVTSTKDISLFTESMLEFGSEMTASLFGNPSYLLNDSTAVVGQREHSDENQNRGDGNQLAEVYLRDFDILEQTEKEVKKIAEILEKNDLKVQTYLDSEALEERVKSMSKPTILHIATHGFFKEINSVSKEFKGNNLPMLSSGLVFAGVTDYYQLSDRRDKEDGILTAYECSTLDLAQTELVVLSACETGLGHLSNGEGVYGLQRGLKISGAKSVMMSLWKVNDLISQELMTTFYQEWMRTGNKLAAFRNAQQELKKKYPHPYHWGGFVLIGENTLFKNSGNNEMVLILWVVGIALLASFIFVRFRR